MLISLTVGKVDAGLAILLTEDKRLIEFPSVLLPPGVASGSIVDIQVSRNSKAEAASRDAFQKLQEEIYTKYGIQSPRKPVLRVRNATQTSIVLEWDNIELASADLRSLTLYRNNSKAGAIPNPTSHTSTKISGLAVDTEYSFHLVLRTSAGTYSSEKVTIRTHKMTDLSGITVCAGVLPAETREALEAALQRIGAKPLQDAVRIDTTHFVCTEGRGPGWERAQDMNIPVVRPEWVEACEREGRIVGVRQFYLGADLSKMRQGLHRSMPSQAQAQPVRSTPSPASPRPSETPPAEAPPAEKENGGSGAETQVVEKEPETAAVDQDTQGQESSPKAETPVDGTAQEAPSGSSPSEAQAEGGEEHDEGKPAEEKKSEENEARTSDGNFVSVSL